MATKNELLKELVDEFASEYKAIADKSRREFIESLKGGDRLPAEGVILDNGNKQLFKDRVRDIHDRAADIIDEEIIDIKAAMTAAPDQDTVNALVLLPMRATITSDELTDLVDRYGENYSAFRAIAGVADDKGEPFFGVHPLEERLKKVSDLNSSLDKLFTLPSAESGHAKPAFIEFIKMSIDDTFPEG